MDLFLDKKLITTQCAGKPPVGASPPDKWELSGGGRPVDMWTTASGRCASPTLPQRAEQADREAAGQSGEMLASPTYPPAQPQEQFFDFGRKRKSRKGVSLAAHHFGRSSASQPVPHDERSTAHCVQQMGFRGMDSLPMISSPYRPKDGRGEAFRCGRRMSFSLRGVERTRFPKQPLKLGNGAGWRV